MALKLLESLLSGVPTWAWIVLALLLTWRVVLEIWGGRIKGKVGEMSVASALGGLDATFYRSFHDLYLPRPDGKGTTQIDHVVVSPFGVFVIETKNYSGWIFGAENQRQWTQSIYKKKHRFQNPLHQNGLHVRALQELLNLDEDRFESIVYFVGESTFKTELPRNVLNKGLSRYIKAFNSHRLSADEVARCIGVLSDLNANTNRRQTSREHVSALRQNRANPPAGARKPSPDPSPAGPAPTCPRCAAPMVRRVARKGTRNGSSFWGCSNFPQCRETCAD